MLCEPILSEPNKYICELDVAYTIWDAVLVNVSQGMVKGTPASVSFFKMEIYSPTQSCWIRISRSKMQQSEHLSKYSWWKWKGRVAQHSGIGFSEPKKFERWTWPNSTNIRNLVSPLANILGIPLPPPNCHHLDHLTIYQMFIEFLFCSRH